jgi:cysteinyl-tRNA synthetase
MQHSLPAIRVTNSLTHVKEDFVPRVPGKVTLYSCGPTVYDFIHIGNLRAAMTSDLFFRGLKGLGYEVDYVRNYTDIDDKIINRAKEEGTTSEVITKRFISEVERDYQVAGLLEPTHKTLVTDHVPEIIQMIQDILAHGNGYVNDDGEVLFSIESFPSYGKLSGKKIEDLIAGHRVEVNQKKKNPMDFSLWKPAKPGEPAWESPWGKGRPGWHIECSAMASKWLGNEIDIHHGGSDLTFPHHENEIAQSECATGHAPYVRYWLHNAMLNINAEKMSKSLGNFVTAREFLTEFGGEVTRYFLLSAHYRSIADFTDEALQTTFSSLIRLYEAKEKAESLRGLRASLPDLRAESLWASFVMEIDTCRSEMRAQISNDFNTPGVLGAVFTLIREWNRICAEPKTLGTPSAIIAATEFLKVIEEDLFQFTGLGRATPRSVLEKIQELKRKRAGGGDASAAVDEAWILAQIQARADAKIAKNFGEADRLRNELLAKGVQIKDSAQGTTWEWSK